MSTCTICGNPAASSEPWNDQEATDCPRCGRWVLLCGPRLPSEVLKEKLGDWDQEPRHRRSQLSRLIRRQRPTGGEPVLIAVNDLDAWRLDDPLPAPAEQLDALILLVGERQRFPGQMAMLQVPEVSACIGCALDTPNVASQRAVNGIAAFDAAFRWLANQPALKELIELKLPNRLVTGSAPPPGEFGLTMAGWERYEALKRAKIDSRIAFMAMQFGDAELNGVVENCFRPAVKRAGFELRVLTDRQRAGLIDDQLRVALRTSRFVIADLTHGNQGAYWEAGFAEGLGRPVIYSCEKAKWDNPETRTHFDTNHRLTIIWERDNLKKAEDKLTDTIRVELPNEAKMEDS